MSHLKGGVVVFTRGVPLGLFSIVMRGGVQPVISEPAKREEGDWGHARSFRMRCAECGCPSDEGIKNGHIR